jgi:hypothetical protein
MNQSDFLSQNRDDLYVFLNNNIEYYMHNWEYLEKNKRIISWNWASFLFFPFWLFYRKMYLFGFFYAIFFMVLDKCIDATSVYQWLHNIINNKILYEVITSLLNIIIASVFGLFGNWLYYQFAIKKITKIKHKITDSVIIKSVLIKNGGVSFKSIILFPIIYSSYDIIVDFIKTNS